MGSRSPGSDDRGQMMVLASVTMAVMFVGMAMFLSAGMHTDIMATQGSDTAAVDAAEATHQTERALASSMAHVNDADAASHDAVARNLTASLASIERALTEEYATRGASYDLASPVTTNGTEVRHDDTDRNFTDSTLATDWTLATDVIATRGFSMTINRSQLAGPKSPDRFEVHIENDTATWSVALANDADTGEIKAEVTTASGSSTCAVAADTARLDLETGTLAGSDCADLAFQSHVEPPYRIGFSDADNATGEYEAHLITTSAVGTASYGPDGSSPRASYSVASVTVRYTYRTTDVHLAANATAP